MRARSTVVEFPVFSNYLVHVEITSNLAKSLAKYSQTEGVEIDDECDHAITVHDKHHGFTFVFLPYGCSAGIIAHECWHVVRRMMEYVGVDLDSETVAYHLGYLVDEIHHFMRKKR